MAENIMSNTAQLLNFNDIIGAIQEDNDYGDPEMSCYGSTIRDTPSEASSISHNERNAYVKIIEEPQPKALRFRYICEGRSAGSIPGIHSTQDNKTYPAIKIVGYKGKAVVVVSCVTVDPPHKPHPHNLVGKESCNKGVCTITIKNESMECVFSNLGIQCVKKKDVEQALRLRKEIRVDPFGTGFSHINQTIDLNAVRLCFQVFIAGRNGEPTIPLKPVVSEPIYDKKATSDLNICKLSHCTSCVSGGQEIILLCDKVSKEDIQIRFFEEKDGQIEWEALGEFSPADVHKQVAITFKTPKYKNLEVINPVSCFIQLQRISDKMGSDPRRFEYLPMDADPLDTKRKRGKNDFSSQDYFKQLIPDLKPGGISIIDQQQQPRPYIVPIRQTRPPSYNIKTEPIDRFSPSPEGAIAVNIPMSSHHKNGGGIMYRANGGHVPMQTHLPPFHYVPSPPNGPMIPIASPQHQPPSFYQVQPTSSYDPSFSPTMLPNESPYSPENTQARASVYPGASMLLPNDSIMDVDPQAEAPIVNSDAVGLPDIGVLNSNELFAPDNFCMSNLSTSLSHSLIIGDNHQSMNNLSKKSNLHAPEEPKTNNNTGEICTPNISLNDHMKSADPLLPMTDSVKKLTTALVDLNNLAQS